jgi:hypothetical protein
VNQNAALSIREAEIASALPRDLDSLPRLRGFRLRGLGFIALALEIVLLNLRPGNSGARSN